MKKQTRQKPKPVKTKTRRVNLDAFGNAIPKVLLSRPEDEGKAMQVVETRDIAVTPAKRHRRLAKSDVVEPARQGWFQRLKGAFRKTPDQESQQAAHDELVDDLSHRMEQAFGELKREFAEREEQLEQKLHQVKEQHFIALGRERKHKTWLIAALGVGGVTVVGYLLLVMTQMGSSMNDMNGNMSSMTGHMETMSGDTQVMSQNLQQMNDSMNYMNYSVGQLNQNVGYMNQNVTQMNHNLGAMNQSVQPIGEAAQTASPVMKFFKSFMPF